MPPLEPPAASLHPSRALTPACRGVRVAFVLLALVLGLPFGATAMDMQTLGQLAWQRAQQPAAAASAESATPLPDSLRQLSYDQARDIRFRPDQAMWHGQNLPFEVMFFHLGKFQTAPVRVHETRGAEDHLVAWNATQFDYGHNTQLHPQDWNDLGFAGWRVHYRLNQPDYLDELAVFQGASYFRVLGRGQRYGLSARGLAVDTVGANAEEFPRFSEFWLERPSADDRSLTAYALLESASVSGAYRFVIYPGEETIVDVQARLFVRRAVGTLGLAPLTSMFAHGENQPDASDFRPRVHDSDGLMMALSQSDGNVEWLWRPLVNPASTLVTSFAATRMQGFGLMQRDRRFADYQDTEARYELRPSVWITPISDWGPGRVELVQLHTPDESNDNVVAYWVPSAPAVPGQPIDISYRMYWQGDLQQTPPSAWVVQTRRGHGFVEPSHPLPAGEEQFLVDFDGPALRSLQDHDAVAAVVTTNENATVLESNPYRNPADGTWRLSIRLQRGDVHKPVEIRAQLRNPTRILTETWTYILPSE